MTTIRARRCLAIACVVLLVGFAFSGDADATLVTLDFSSLPSTQGWSFVKTTTGSHANDTETGTFSVASSVLTMNTIGTGTVSPSSLGYSYPGIVNSAYPWTLEWRFRITAYENPFYSYATYFQVSDGSSRFFVGANQTTVSVLNGSGVGTDYANDNTGFQTFRMQYTPNAGSGLFSLYIDNSLFASGIGGATTSDRLHMGDGTGAANSRWEMTSYQFTQIIPEPTSLALCGAGLLIAAAAWRRRTRASAH